MLERRSRCLRVLTSSFLLALAAGNSTAGDLIVVDETGSADYLEIQQAVSAAQDGDLILVLSGTYAGFTVDDKDLHVAAVDGAVVDCRGNVVVRNVSQGKTVTLRDLDVTPLAPSSSETTRALWLENNSGGVRITGCSFTGNGTFGLIPTGGFVEGSADVAMTSCSFDGGFASHGGDALVIEDSNVALLRTSCTGQTGYQALDEFDLADDGGTGLVLQGTPGEFIAAGSTFTGGTGGYGECGTPGDGGDALHAGNWSPWLLDVLIVPGTGGTCYPTGFGTGCCSFDGGSGQGIVGQVTQLAGASRHLDVPQVAVESGLFPVSVQGEVGDQVYLFAGTGTGFDRQTRYNGAFLLEQPLLAGVNSTTGGGTVFAGLPLEQSRLFLGSIPASGVLNAMVATKALMTGLDAQPAYLQAALRDTLGDTWVTDSLRVDIISCGSIGTDCNGNGTIDSCDIGTGASLDCNLDGIPDECQWDCNSNGIPDDCDITSGMALDMNGNSIPDTCEGAIRLFVDADALSGGDGRSWGGALTDLQEAIALHRSHPVEVQDIWVAEGTYKPTQDLDPDVFFSPAGGARIFGGFAGNETSFAQRDVDAHLTVLSGDLSGNDSYPSGMGENSQHVLLMDFADPDVLLDGFEISGGNGNNGSNSYGAGGGILVNGAQDFVISRCTIRNNKAEYGGGVDIGRYYIGTFPVGDFLNCVIEDNRTTGTTFVLTHSGGGVRLREAGLIRFINCEIINNHAVGYGGGIAEEPLNQGVEDRVQILACTITGNTSDNGAGGIHVYTNGAGVTAVQGSIVWGNTGAGGTTAQQIKTFAAEVTVKLSCVQGNSVWPGTGNTNADPSFVDELSGDYRLAAGSPCIDASRNGLLPAEDPSDLDQDGDLLEELPLDLGGNPRRMDDPAVPDTGSGAAPVIDMGAHERDPSNP